MGTMEKEDYRVVDSRNRPMFRANNLQAAKDFYCGTPYGTVLQKASFNKKIGRYEWINLLPRNKKI